MEHLNIIIAVTNFVAIIPIIKSIIAKDYILALLIFLTMMASFTSHLGEQRHGLPGYILIEYFTILNYIDIILAIILIIHRFQMFGIMLMFDCNFITISCTAILFWILAIIYGNNPYCWSIFHSIWHVLAFLILDATILL
jgi:hypothetical protein